MHCGHSASDACGISLIERNSTAGEPRIKEGHRSKPLQKETTRVPKRESFSTSQVVGGLVHEDSSQLLVTTVMEMFP